MENIIIKAQHNCFSDNTQYSGSFIPILHEYVLIVRKDAPKLIPILETRRLNVDVRDMVGATWKDIVAAVMEEHKGIISLSELYEKIEPYKKAQKNQYWREKIRQTLQLYKEYFQSPQRGMWCLRKRKCS